MVLGWLGGAKEEDVDALIARKKYGQAVEVLLDRFKHGEREPRLRMQLADVLALSGKKDQAIPILVGLADEYATEGFAAKAIALFKKIQKLAPGRADVERRLAQLIEKKQGEPGAAAASAPMPELGMEEIGMEAASLNAPADERSAAPRPEPPPRARPAAAAPAAPPELPEAETHEGESVHDDLLGELEAVLAEPAPRAAAPAPPTASPLFSDFDHDELLAVMQGLELLSYEPGDIIITQGEPGDSLFILTTGVAKAFVKSPAGQHVKVREMDEGSFFGEISILTGSPRTATVTAAAPCELLVLDRATLDGISAQRPRVREVLQEFYEKRRGNN